MNRRYGTTLAGMVLLSLCGCATAPDSEDAPALSAVAQSNGLPAAGSLITANVTQKVYVYARSQKMWVKNPTVLERCGYRFSDVVQITAAELNAIEEGPELNSGACLMLRKEVITGDQALPVGLIAKASSPSTVYFAVPGEAKRLFSMDSLTAVAVINEAFSVSTAAVRIVADRLVDDLPEKPPLPSMNSVLAAINFARKFGMVVNGDPQFIWGCKSEGYPSDGYCGTAAAKDKSNEWQAFASNELQRTSMKALIDFNKTNVPIKGVIINGDLTDFGDQREMLGKFKEYYRPEFFNLPVWMGLGNHDIFNTVNDCGYAMTKNYCAAQMAQFMAQQLWDNAIPRVNHNVTNYQENPLQSGSQRNVSGSLAYSWNLRDFHFVQLHNYPGFSIDFQRGYESGISSWDIDLNSSEGWLGADLDDYKGMKFVLNWHRYSDLPDDAKTRIKEMLRPYRKDIVAIFVGHIHRSAGKIDSIDYEDETEIPIINSGSPIHSRYIHATFENAQGTCQFVTQVKNSINSDGSKAVYEDSKGWDANKRPPIPGHEIEGRFAVSCLRSGV